MHPTKKILVVDDEPGIVKLLEKRLEAHRFNVVSAQNGQEALELVENELPDLIILDVMMPGLNGYQVCHTIKSNPVTGHIPILILTAKKTQTAEDWGKQVHADAFLKKPFDSRELLFVVEKLLVKPE